MLYDKYDGPQMSKNTGKAISVTPKLGPGAGSGVRVTTNSRWEKGSKSPMDLIVAGLKAKGEERRVRLAQAIQGVKKD